MQGPCQAAIAIPPGHTARAGNAAFEHLRPVAALHRADPNCSAASRPAPSHKSFQGDQHGAGTHGTVTGGVGAGSIQSAAASRRLRRDRSRPARDLPPQPWAFQAGSRLHPLPHVQAVGDNLQPRRIPVWIRGPEPQRSVPSGYSSLSGSRHRWLGVGQRLPGRVGRTRRPSRPSFVSTMHVTVGLQLVLGPRPAVERRRKRPPHGF